MTILFPLIWTAGLPRVPRFVTMRELVAEHLAWERSARVPLTEEADDAEDEGEGASGTAGDETDAALLDDGTTAAEDAGPLAPPSEEEVRERLVTALRELLGTWQDQVVDTVPSQVLLGLGAFADRAAYLLDDLLPGHAARFAGLRDLLMDHTQGGRKLPDEELHRVAAEVEATFKEFFPPEPDAWRP